MIFRVRSLLCVGVLAVSSLAWLGGCAWMPPMPFSGSNEEQVQETRQRARAGRALAASLSVSPEALALKSTRRLTAVFRIENRSGRVVNLQFPGEQRFEVEVADDRGSVLARWSDDRAFSRQPSFAAVNPGEELVYTAVLPTRDLQAGRSYTLDACLLGYDKVRARQTITPGE